MTDSIGRLRRHARAAFDAAVAAAQPERLLASALRRVGSDVEVLGTPLPTLAGRRLVVALGKAGPALASAWIEILPGWTDQVVVLAPHQVEVPEPLAVTATVLRGGHPLPDDSGAAATRRLLALAEGLDASDLMVVLLSGGGSAVLAAPADGLSLEDVRATTRALLLAGASIGALNTVRRQVLAAAGGGLARAAHPARIVTLVLSDVIGDPLPDIASGPTVAPPTGSAEALAVLTLHGVCQSVPGTVVRWLQRSEPDDHSEVAPAHTEIIGNNRTAVDAAARSLACRGYQVTVVGQPLAGEAAACGRQLGALAAAMAPKAPAALVLGGETTVTVHGAGRGGRSQELAVAAALLMDSGPARVVLAAGTDGIDGRSANAGAVVDSTTATRARARGIDLVRALAANDSATALARLGDTVVTGPTGTNVGDVALVLAGV